MAQKEQPVPNTTPSAGARLKQVRLAKGISFDDAHEKTKIHPNILKAIEEDNLANVSPIYTKGFLKIYCSFLGVNPADYIPDYRKPQARVPYSPVASEGGRSSSSGSAMKAFSMRVKDWLLRVKIKQVLVIVVVLIAAVMMFKLVKYIASRPKPQPARVENPFQRPSRKSMQQREKAAVPVRTAVPVVAATSDEPVKAIEKKPAVAVPSPIRLIIRAKEDCFVQLKTDGHTVFQGAVKKNRFESWQAKEKIEFSLSNAGAVELEVNGKTMTNIGRRKQALKNIVITREGLSIL